ncbi:MAG: tetratricopeptide repeat protein [Verrucomicrobia bacterium]|nr:tetratricopeptide repeat protein [Verrucomicrobiota bacterium]
MSVASLAIASELDREIILAPHRGAAREDVEIRARQERAAAPRAKADDFEQLGWAFVAKARRTLDPGYYKLAEKAADVIDARFGVRAESRLLRGHVLHNVHRFREAEAMARQLVGQRGLPEDFALLSDALLEQGNLGEAIQALQRMVDLKPGMEAYSRIAQVRWLKGDLGAAISAMETAVRATSPRDAEASAWTLARLAGFYLHAGRIEPALNAADAAVGLAANFPPALLARGRALLGLGKNATAASVLARAADLNPFPEYQWWLADTLRLAGRTGEATRIESELRARGAQADPRTLALFLATRGDAATDAVRLARDELANRGDVFTHDALAWALAASGDAAAADAEMRAALAERTQDARLFWHAGEIALARGATMEADEFFRKARPLAATLTPSERGRLGDRLQAAVAPVQGTFLTQKNYPLP